jgi:hypothetical protein
MTIEDRKLFSQGKDFWHQYVYLMDTLSDQQGTD